MKISIVCDDYKLNKFKRALKKGGFKYKTKPFFSDATCISVNTEPARLKELEKLCRTVEIDVKQGN